jgi:hypothetical protein
VVDGVSVKVEIVVEKQVMIQSLMVKSPLQEPVEAVKEEVL